VHSQEKISAYARVDRSNGVNGIKQVLASGYPIIFGFTVFGSFESDQVAQTGILNMPVDGEQCQGGHAVLMVGYDNATQRVIVRNFLGGKLGAGWILYNAISIRGRSKFSKRFVDNNQIKYNITHTKRRFGAFFVDHCVDLKYFLIYYINNEN
jgi:C1A family cysteine protease